MENLGSTACREILELLPRNLASPPPRRPANPALGDLPARLVLLDPLELVEILEEMVIQDRMDLPAHRGLKDIQDYPVPPGLKEEWESMALPELMENPNRDHKDLQDLWELR